MIPKFLAVDDDPDARAVLEAILGSLGCEVTLAENGNEALKILEAQGANPEFDAIFLDVMMPGLSGYETLRRIRQNQNTKEIPIIMLTSKDRGDDVIEGYTSGAEYYITKPFTQAQIVYGLDIVLAEEEPSGEAIPTFKVDD